MRGCSSRQQPACTAGAHQSRSSKCLWSCEACSCASHPPPRETPGQTGKQEVKRFKEKSHKETTQRDVIYEDELSDDEI